MSDETRATIEIIEHYWQKGGFYNDIPVEIMNTIINELEEKDKEIEQLKRQIKIKNKYCQLIHDIGFDYDGYSKADDLKMIIDELVSYSIDAINCDEKKVMYVDSNGKETNILMEGING